MFLILWIDGRPANAYLLYIFEDKKDINIEQLEKNMKRIKKGLETNDWQCFVVMEYNNDYALDMTMYALDIDARSTPFDYGDEEDDFIFKCQCPEKLIEFLKE
jgi:hypothetical protein